MAPNATTPGLHAVLSKVHFTTGAQCSCRSQLRSAGNASTCCGTMLADGTVLEGLFASRWREVCWQLRLEEKWSRFNLTWLVVTGEGRVRVVDHHGKMACAV